MQTLLPQLAASPSVEGVTEISSESSLNASDYHSQQEEEEEQEESRSEDTIVTKEVVTEPTVNELQRKAEAEVEVVKPTQNQNVVPGPATVASNANTTVKSQVRSNSHVTRVKTATVAAGPSTTVRRAKSAGPVTNNKLTDALPESVSIRRAVSESQNPKLKVSPMANKQPDVTAPPTESE